MKNYIFSNTYIILFITFFLFYSLSLSNLGFIFNIPITFYHAPVFFLLSMVSSLFFMEKKNYVYSFISLLIYFGIAYLGAIYFFDTSWDGQIYHQECIIALKGYWNPLKELSHTKSSIWIDHYQIGVETIQAVIYAFTNKIEAGKMINILLLIATYLLVKQSFQLFFKLKIYSILFALLTVLSPITIVQTFTYYIDAYYYLILLCLISSSILWIKNNDKKYFIIFTLLSVLICCIKVSTIPTYMLLLASLFFYLFPKKRNLLKPLYISISIVFVFSVINNYHPFITNISKGKHIFHPLMGSEKVDIMTPNTPKELLGKNRFTKFLLSSISKFHHMEYEPKIPFTIHKSEKSLSLIASSDNRLSGFGLLFSGIMVLTILSFLYYFIFIKEKQQQNKLLYYIIFWLILSIIINPEFWWPRYTPQIWLIPILALLIIWNTRSKALFVIKYFTIIILFINSMMTLLPTILMNLYKNNNINNFLQTLKEANKTVIIDDPIYHYNIGTRLSEYHIKYIEDTLSEGFDYVPETFNNVKYKISDK